MRFVYGILPAFMRYKAKSDRAGGAKFIFIYINNKYKDDQGIINHELMHVKQFYRMSLLSLWGVVIYLMGGLMTPLVIGVIGFCAHTILYRFSESYRYVAEVEAFKVQLKSYDRSEMDYDATVRKLVYILVTRYNVDVSLAQAREDILS